MISFTTLGSWKSATTVSSISRAKACLAGLEGSGALRGGATAAGSGSLASSTSTSSTSSTSSSSSTSITTGATLGFFDSSQSWLACSSSAATTSSGLCNGSASALPDPLAPRPRPLAASFSSLSISSMLVFLCLCLAMFATYLSLYAPSAFHFSWNHASTEDLPSSTASWYFFPSTSSFTSLLVCLNLENSAISFLVLCLSALTLS
mmetsp:Transcript_5066/g.17791  ORF Transcript_5066/g.17791 Transcript_5066/m.17791 type:complete len:206 (-) Transcript_5066:257-874(-)